MALSAPSARAWGPIGHRMVAETAAILVRDREPGPWGEFLARHRFQLGYYAYIPDARSRAKDGAGGAIEGPTHVLNLDLLLGSSDIASASPDEVLAMPRDYPGARAWLERRIGPAATASVGTAPWRAAQFLTLASLELAQMKALDGGYVSGARASGDVARAFRALVHLGLLSHYSGDAGVPWHATSDANGVATGQTGIHFYFENHCVNALEPDLAAAVLAEARSHADAWLAAWQAASEPPAGLVLRVFRDAGAALEELARIDLERLVLARADTEVCGDAVRPAYALGCPLLRPLLVTQLAKAAVLTAELFRRALPPSVDTRGASALEIFDVEVDPAFVYPDYLDLARARE